MVADIGDRASLVRHDSIMLKETLSIEEPNDFDRRAGVGAAAWFELGRELAHPTRATLPW